MFCLLRHSPVRLITSGACSRELFRIRPFTPAWSTIASFIRAQSNQCWLLKSHWNLWVVITMHESRAGVDILNLCSMSFHRVSLSSNCCISSLYVILPTSTYIDCTTSLKSVLTFPSQGMSLVKVGFLYLHTLKYTSNTLGFKWHLENTQKARLCTSIRCLPPPMLPSVQGTVIIPEIVWSQQLCLILDSTKVSS